jgi:hypothetical protein
MSKFRGGSRGWVGGRGGSDVNSIEYNLMYNNQRADLKNPKGEYIQHYMIV